MCIIRRMYYIPDTCAVYSYETQNRKLQQDKYNPMQNAIYEKLLIQIHGEIQSK